MSRFPRLAALALGAVLALGACATGTPPSQSYAETTLLTPEARQSLEARVRAFDREINRGNMAATIDYLPPKMIAQISAETGATPEFMRAAAGAMVEGMTAGMKISGGHDITKAVVGTTGTGAPYAVIPGMARISVGGETMDNPGYTLALTDAGKWYLVALNDQESITDIRKAYPEFNSVALPLR